MVIPVMKSQLWLEKIEKARSRYCPRELRILFVAEAPPLAPERFFYYGHVPKADWLFLGIMKALYPEADVRRYLEEGRPAHLKEAMLDRFCANGYYLMDLCPLPVSMCIPEQQATDFISRLRDLEARGLLDRTTPIILIKKNVHDILYDRLRKDGYRVIDRAIPFPSSGQQRRFAEEFQAAIRQALHR